MKGVPMADTLDLIVIGAGMAVAEVKSMPIAYPTGASDIGSMV